MTYTANIGHKTIECFSEEWTALDQTDLPIEEKRRIFDYSSVFPFADLLAAPSGDDLGCVTDVLFREGVPFWAARMRKA